MLLVMVWYKMKVNASLFILTVSEVIAKVEGGRQREKERVRKSI